MKKASKHGKPIVDLFCNVALVFAFSVFLSACGVAYEPVTSSTNSNETKNSSQLPPPDEPPAPPQEPGPPPPEPPFSEPPPAPVPDPTPSACGAMSDVECAVFDLVNIERAANGVAPLGVLSNCVAEAQGHAQDMSDQGFFSHDNTVTGETTSQRFSRFGLSGTWGENIAKGQTSPAQVMTAWMNSPGHRSNILNSVFKSMGVGFFNNHWVQCFSGQSPNN